MWMGLMASGFSQENRSLVDSTFWVLSLPELQSYRAYYVQELEELQQEKKNLIQRGIEDGETLLQMKPDTKVVDEILIRLADLYYYREKDDYLASMEAYDGQLIQYEQGEIVDLPEEPKLDCQQSLEIYQRIIDEFPQSELVDDAIYNRAFLFEEMGQNENANKIYRHLIDAYPKSRYVPEAQLRLGEYYFNPPVNDIHQAISFYKKVLEHRNSPRYDEALYKLGWSYYRLSQYPEAISYFTTLVENLRVEAQYDPLGMEVRNDLGDEAIEYIAISFIDFGGSDKALEYLREIGDPEWGDDVLAKLGDVYMKEKEEYQNSIMAYEALLNYSPSSSDAPAIQRKIVECYGALNDETNAFDVREKLFVVYKPDGSWWNETKDEKAKLRAYRLTEQALRENINTVIKRAEELSSRSHYEQAIELGRTYLESFPEDLYAYMIRWNIALILDMKLQLYKEALQEYLTLSMVYNENQYEKFARDKGLATIRDAAENAIVAADSLVQRERRQTEVNLVVQTVDNKKEAIPLTTAESMLAMAYDNYIKNFPFDKNTPTVLANAGALYYTHNQFSEALKYFKTLVKYFPRSEQIQTIQYSILESYIGKQDFESAEILAKKIIDETPSDEIKRKAEKRLGEAIFLKAQAHADAGKGSLAANEYYRMALEVPSLEFADRALFNAGKEYEHIQDYSSAIRAYELLRVSYSGSPLLRDALNNLAFDYGEMGEYQKGAERYEVLANLLKEGEGARDALYNAYIFYIKAENWWKATSTGESYVFHYPDAKDASTVYLRTGDYYLKLNDVAGAVRIFSRFAEQFPDSPLVVEAYFNLGKYYYDRDSFEKAEETFRQTFTRSETLRDRGLEHNGYYAAEALYFASRLLHDRYNKILFTLPQASLDQALARKESLLQQLVDQYTTVVSYETQRLPESVYRIGEVYENFAQTWSNQEIPPMDPTLRAVKEKEINGRTTQIYSRALTAYKKAIPVLTKVLGETPLSEDADSASTSSVSDSVVLITNSWLDKAKEKVSETLYQMAELNTQSIERLLNAPIPADLNEMARLEYKNQVLVRAIKPLLEVVEEAHRRNLHVADSLGLKNEWTEASRSKILTSLNLLAQEYGKLALDALEGYRRSVRNYRRITLSENGEASEDLLHSMVNFIDLSKSYSQDVVLNVKESVEKVAESRIGVSEIMNSQDGMIRFVLQLADTLEKLITLGLEDQNKAEELFESMGDLRYEDILAAFEDNVFFLKRNLKTILELAYRTDKEFKNPSPLGGWIKAWLVRMDPEMYTGEMSVPIEEMVVSTDTTWLYATNFLEGWKQLDFNTTGWYRAAQRIDSGIPSGNNRDLQIYGVSPTGSENFFFIRKEINIPGFPILGRMYFQMDSTSRVFVNSMPMVGNMEAEPYSMTSYLREGKNLLAMECPRAERFSIGGAVMIRYIPKAALPKKEN